MKIVNMREMEFIYMKFLVKIKKKFAIDQIANIETTILSDILMFAYTIVPDFENNIKSKSHFLTYFSFNLFC